MPVVKNLIVDSLGATLASIADLKDTADTMKAGLISQAATLQLNAFEGDLFRATVSFGNKTVVDYKAILAALVDYKLIEQGALDKLVAANTRTAEGVPTVRVTARK